MAQLIGIGNLGRDAELRHLPDGTPVANIAIAFSYGKKGSDGNRSTQWVDASLWGSRAETLVEYLVRGTRVYVVLDDVHIETYQGQNGPGHKLVGKVSTLEFAGSPGGSGQQQDQQQGRQQAQQQAPRQGQQQQRQPAQQQRQQTQQRQQPQQRQQQQPQGGGGDYGFDNMDDDIPFISSNFSFDAESKLGRRMRRSSRTRRD